MKQMLQLILLWNESLLYVDELTSEKGYEQRAKHAPFWTLMECLELSLQNWGLEKTRNPKMVI